MGGSCRAPSGWEEDVSPLFPDAATRAAVTAGRTAAAVRVLRTVSPRSHRLGRRRGLRPLAFGPPYEEMAAHARSRGWLVEELAGQHLHQLVDPDPIADRLITMAVSLAERDSDGLSQ